MPRLNRQRAALVLANGKIYIAFTSFCDIGNYHGWIFSYSYNGSSFEQVNAYNDTPNGMQGGIWGGDAALDADSSGNLYYMSGNGTFDANTGGPDYRRQLRAPECRAAGSGLLHALQPELPQRTATRTSAQEARC